MPNALPKDRAPENVAETIRQMVVSGELSAGAKVNEVELAETLSISRTPLREALRALETEGFVRSEHNRGFWIAALESDEVRELYPIMWTLEKLAVSDGWLLLRGRIEILREINALFGKKGISAKQAARRDEEFHAELVGNTTNSELRSMIASLKRRISRYEAVYMGERGLPTVSYDHHEKIISSINKGDLPKTLSTLEENWRYGMDALLRTLSTQQEA